MRFRLVTKLPGSVLSSLAELVWMGGIAYETVGNAMTCVEILQKAFWKDWKPDPATKAGLATSILAVSSTALMVVFGVGWNLSKSAMFFRNVCTYAVLGLHTISALCKELIEAVSSC